MITHPQKTAVELTVLPNKHSLNRRFHSVIDAARAGSSEESKGAVVRVEQYLQVSRGYTIR
jgi:hypothetical protein